MDRLVYIIISFLFLNLFFALEYNAEVSQLICRQNTHACCGPQVLQLVANLNDENDYLCTDFDLCNNEPNVALDFGFEYPINKNFNSFILFEADVSPPLYFS